MLEFNTSWAFGFSLSLDMTLGLSFAILAECVYDNFRLRAPQVLLNLWPGNRGKAYNMFL